MLKKSIGNIREQNQIIDNILNAFSERKTFLLCGHKHPDEDCVASLVAVAILLNRFDKAVSIYINNKIPDNLSYLLNICRYNSIKIINEKNKIKDPVDTIVICDTPNSKMLEISKSGEKLIKKQDVLKIEFDHHIGGDGEYIGDEGFRLVTNASSTCELIGVLAIKLKSKKQLLSRYMISDPFSRNFVLSIITGIIGDTNMGQFLKSRREKRLYNVFTGIYNDILMKTTVRESNFTRIDEIFNVIQKISQDEEYCYKYLMDRHSVKGSTGYVVLKEEDTAHLFEKFDEDTFITVTKSVANDLAEKSGKLSLIAYYDDKKKSDLIQFRMRRSHDFKNYDLRNILQVFSISNGGGHEGAIGFRFSRSTIDDLDSYVTDFLERLEVELDVTLIKQES